MCNLFVVEVKMTSGKNDKPKIINNEDGTDSMKDESFHELHVKRIEETIPGNFLNIFSILSAVLFINRVY